MSPDKPTSAATNPHRKILWLVVGHIVVGLIGAAYFADSDKTLRSATFLGIVFSQTSLLGIWGGLGPNPWWQRVIGVVVGVGYLVPLLGLGISDLSRETIFVVILATTFVAVPLLIVRFFKVAVQLDSVLVASVGRIQFSIRHLMILTFIVACLITIGKSVQPWVDRGDIFFGVLLGNIVLRPFAVSTFGFDIEVADGLSAQSNRYNESSGLFFKGWASRLRE